MSAWQILTKPQRRELLALARGPQSTYGNARANVQNRLCHMRLAIVKDDGFMCEITDEGRAVLAKATAQK